MLEVWNTVQSIRNVWLVSLQEENGGWKRAFKLPFLLKVATGAILWLESLSTSSISFDPQRTAIWWVLMSPSFCGWGNWGLRKSSVCKGHDCHVSQKFWFQSLSEILWVCFLLIFPGIGKRMLAHTAGILWGCGSLFWTHYWVGRNRVGRTGNLLPMPPLTPPYPHFSLPPQCSPSQSGAAIAVKSPLGADGEPREKMYVT